MDTLLVRCGHGRRRDRLGRGLRPPHLHSARKRRSIPSSGRCRRTRSHRDQRAGGRGPSATSAASAATARDCTRCPRSTSRCGTSPASSPAAALSPARRLARARSCRLREPAASRRAGCRYAVRRARAKRGYRHIKLHEITVPPIKAARDAAGPISPIMVDCNCPWDRRRSDRDGAQTRAVQPQVAGGGRVAA